MVPEKKMNLIERKIQSSCECEDGCNKCRAKFARYKSYSRANIPQSYWSLPFKNFQGDPNFGKYVSDRISNVNAMYEDGTSMAFVGNLGTGKTYAACCILKVAIVNGHTAMYVNMSDVINEVSKNNYEYLEQITNFDFICIDEFDSRWVFPSEKAEQLFGQTMERILRERFQNGLPTILCSNTVDIATVLSGDFSRAIDSLFSKYVKVLYVSGKDFRKIPGKGVA